MKVYAVVTVANPGLGQLLGPPALVITALYEDKTDALLLAGTRASLEVREFEVVPRGGRTAPEPRSVVAPAPGESARCPTCESPLRNLTLPLPQPADRCDDEWHHGAG